jgi:dolichol kinase
MVQSGEQGNLIGNPAPITAYRGPVQVARKAWHGFESPSRDLPPPDNRIQVPPMSPFSWYQAEISRKVLHVIGVVIPLVYVFLHRETMLRLLAPFVLLAVTIELLRVTGATYVMIGALLSVWWFSKPVAIAALLIQTISDAAASLIGQRFGRQRFLGKSLAGSGAFFITAVIILWAALPDSKGIGLAAALVATLAEALPALRLGRFELNDNLTVPLLTGTTIWLLGGGASPTPFAWVLVPNSSS